MLSIKKNKERNESFGPSQSLRNKPFTIIPNELLQLKGVSLGFRALMPYLLSLPHDWVVYNSHLAAFLMVGRDKMRAIVKEAIQLGYMRRTPKKNADGRFVGWHTEYSDCPEFLASDGLPENPSVGNSDGRENRHYKINNLTKKTNYKNNNTNKVIKVPKNKPVSHIEPTPGPKQMFLEEHKPEPKPTAEPQNEPNGVVVVISEIDDLIKMVRGWAISRVLINAWVKKYGAAYVLQKIELTKTANAKKPGAYLNKAIELDWLPPAPTEDENVQNKPVEPTFPTHEENIAWYNNLAQEEKIMCLKTAVHKQGYFEEHLKNAKASVLDTNFTDSYMFKSLMQYVGRAP